MSFASKVAYASLFVGAAQANPLFASVQSNGHAAQVSNIEKSNSKWLKFPEQKSLHAKSIEGEKLSWDSIVKSDANFWKNHGSNLGLSSDNEMRLTKEWKISASHSYQKYDQYVHGVRVFGGEYQLTIGRHGGVMSAHGLPLSAKSRDHYNFDKIHSKINENELLSIVENHVIKNLDMDVKLMTNIEIEQVWYMSQVHVAKQGQEFLAYYINGRSKTGPHISFDAFIDINTMQVLYFLETSDQLSEQKNVETAFDHRELQLQISPFAAPINDTDIFVYDQYLKDFNDDEVDDYYSEDPDRYSNYTLVWDSVEYPKYNYPTTDSELNYLVDNSLYVKYMYYSLSNGQYLSWNESDFDWNIEYNLTIANAYFDGVWGIHFGTGYITDDVVSHEWSHG